MIQRRLVLILLGVSLTVAAPASAQRSGFIIGFGLGSGYYSPTEGVERSNPGVGMDFHIGGALGNGLELYFMQKVISRSDVTASGVGGVGVAYPVTPTIDVHGGIGVGIWTESRMGTLDTDREGLGLVGGARYKLNDSGRWMLNADIMYGRPRSGLSVFGFQLTINVMSH